VLDVLIAGGMVVDGTGSPARPADVGVRDGRVVVLGRAAEPARRVIDANGLAVCPGFVDIHTHYDAQLGWDPLGSPSVLHGVTTVIGGNCGFALAPLAAGDAAYIMQMMARVEGMPLAALEQGLSWDWTSFGEWFGRLEGRVTPNVGFLAGHSTVRRYVMGERAGEPALDGDVDAMVIEIQRALAGGALGFSTSRSSTHSDGEGDPVPSRAASRTELLRLAAAAGSHAGTNLEVIPARGMPAEDVDLMTEMSLVARRAVNWNLLVVDSASGEEHRLRLEASDRAAERGARVVALTLPDHQRLRLTFEAGFVLDALPGWGEVMRLPATERMTALLNPAIRARLAHGAASPEAGSLGRVARWPLFGIAETFAPENEGLAGRTVGDVAAERGVAPFDLLLEVVVADRLRTGLTAPPTSDDDDEAWQERASVWRDPRTVVGGSDAGAHLDMTCGATYTTAMLGHAVRERGLLSLEEAVHQLADVPARFYHLAGRGRLAEGCWADIVLVDPGSVGPGPLETRADLPGGASRLFAGCRGVERVLVNGVDAVVAGAPTGAMPGVVLRPGIRPAA
jgi:N-acyl-D-aspartate/D-glutamate deacylase